MDEKLDMTKEEILQEVDESEIIKDDIEGMDDEALELTQSQRELYTDKQIHQ